MVNDMKQVENTTKNGTAFVPTDVSVSVTCKPKRVYPSSSTNWANDMVSVRLSFRDEHELPIEENKPELADIPDNKAPFLISLRDSLLQFRLMSIPADYKRINERGDHLARENLRVDVLLKRIEETLEVLKYEETIKSQDLDKLFNGLKELQKALQYMSQLFCNACINV